MSDSIVIETDYVEGNTDNEEIDFRLRSKKEKLFLKVKSNGDIQFTEFWDYLMNRKYPYFSTPENVHKSLENLKDLKSRRL
jgi:DNA-directed RNA polymerase alpha subunit